MKQSPRSKAIDISDATKRKVYERQQGLSITGKYSATYNYHHYVTKGSNGVGFEWNVIMLTPEEHIQVHSGGKVFRYTNEEFKTLMGNHLKIHYSGWSVKKCKYHEGFNEEDYGVKYAGNMARN